MRSIAMLAALFLVVDTGFIVYWGIVGLNLVPEAYLFKDYHDPILKAWNWSFLPLDILISVTGYLSLILWRYGQPLWEKLALVSVTLMFCSGLQAIAFWTLRQDYDPLWWIPNLCLMAFPLLYGTYGLFQRVVPGCGCRPALSEPGSGVSP